MGSPRPRRTRKQRRARIWDPHQQQRHATELAAIELHEGVADITDTTSYEPIPRGVVVDFVVESDDWAEIDHLEGGAMTDSLRKPWTGEQLDALVKTIFREDGVAALPMRRRSTMDSHEAKAVLRDQYAAERAKERARDTLLCAIHEWIERADKMDERIRNIEKTVVALDNSL